MGLKFSQYWIVLLLLFVVGMAASILPAPAMGAISTDPGKEKITVWQMFFLMLTVIPFSKLILSVFVKMVAPNKRESDKWTTVIAGVALTRQAVGGLKQGIGKGYNSWPRVKNKKPTLPKKTG